MASTALEFACSVSFLASVTVSPAVQTTALYVTSAMLTPPLLSFDFQAKLFLY